MFLRINRAFKKSRAEDGFTLLELLVVIVLIGILAAIAVPVFINAQNAAHDASVKSDARNTVIGVASALVTKPDASGFSVLAAGDTVAAVKLFGVPSVVVTVPTGAVAVRAVVTQSNWVTVRGTGADYVVHAQSTVDGFWYEFSSKTGKYTSSSDNPAVTPGVPSSTTPVPNSVQNPTGVAVRVPGDPITSTTSTGGTGATAGAGAGSGNMGLETPAIALAGGSLLLDGYNTVGAETVASVSGTAAINLALPASVSLSHNGGNQSPVTYLGKTYNPAYVSDGWGLAAIDGTQVTGISTGGATVTGLTVLGGKLYFTGTIQTTTTTYTTSIYSYDGTTMTQIFGTQNVAAPENIPSLAPNRQQMLAVLGTKLYYIGLDSTNGFQLWFYDTSTGSGGIASLALPKSFSVGTDKPDYNAGRGGWRKPAGLTVASGIIYVVDYSTVSNSGYPAGFTIWSFDGISDMMKTNLPPAATRQTSPAGLTVMGGNLYATTGPDLTHLSLYGFTGSVATITANTANSGLYEESYKGLNVVADGKIFYTATSDNGATSNVLLAFNGTDTTLLASAPVGVSLPVVLGYLNGKIILDGFDSAHGEEPWVWDGTTLKMLSDVTPGTGGTYPTWLGSAGSTGYFTNNTDGTTWSTDGTNAQQMSPSRQYDSLVGILAP